MVSKTQIVVQKDYAKLTLLSVELVRISQVTCRTGQVLELQCGIIRYHHKLYYYDYKNKRLSRYISMYVTLWNIVHFCKEAKLQARIKLTALCSAFDKENSIEFPLDFLYYLYNYYIVYALLSHAYYVIHHVMSCDVMLWLPVMWLWLCDTHDVTLSHTPFCVVSPR